MFRWDSAHYEYFMHYFDVFNYIFIINVFPGCKWPPFFFYLTTLILTKRIDVKHVDVNVYRVTKTYFWEHLLFGTKAQMPYNSE